MIHANGAVELANDTTAFELWIAKLTNLAKQNWAAGFTAGCESFPNAWPTKSMSQQDRAMRRLISDSAVTGFTESDLRLVAQWFSSRYQHVK